MRNNPFLSAANDDDFPTCPGCHQQVYPKDRPLMALGAKWHPQCLKCTSCGAVLTVRSLESFQKLPYCKAHVPRAGYGVAATTVSDDFHTKDVAAKPKAASRQQGVDVTARQTFVGTGNLAKGGADASASFGGGKADSGTFEVGPRAERVADAGVAYGTNQSDSGTFENQPSTYDASMYASEYNTGGAKPAPTGSRPAGPPQTAAAPPARSAAPPPSRGAPAGRGAAPAVPPPAAKIAPPPPVAPPPTEEYYDENQGYDQGAYDQQGYDQQGYDQQGYDQQGYDPNQGYDENQGYDQQHYDPNQQHDENQGW